MELDSQIRTQALQEASDIYEKITDAMKNPTISITGEAKTVYDEIIAWNMTDDFPFLENRGLYITMIAMTRYRHIRWAIEHPKKEKKKKTKWQHVYGSRLKR